MSLLKNRGSLVAVSSSFRDMAMAWRGILEQLGKQSLGPVSEQISEAAGVAADAADRSGMVDYGQALLQCCGIIVSPELYKKASEWSFWAERSLTERFFSGRHLFEFCKSQSLDPINSGARIVHNTTFAEASHHFEWKGTIIEAYWGSHLTPMEDRKPFIVFLPNRQIVARSSLSLKVRDQKIR